MPKTKVVVDPHETFGERLARIRKAAGFSQSELGREIGISQRMMAYYEGQTEHPPTKLLPVIAKALGVTTDELLGLAPTSRRTPDSRLWRRFKELEQLPPDRRRQILQVLDTFLENERLRKPARAARDR